MLRLQHGLQNLGVVAGLVKLRLLMMGDGISFLTDRKF